MAYNEYFNYANCSDTITYTNTNSCTVSYGNYLNQGHDNYDDNCWQIIYHDNSHSNHLNYGHSNYNNSVNDCVTSMNHVNHTNYSNPNTALPSSDNLPWDSWNKNSSTNITLPTTYISESLTAIKQLRNNLDTLLKTKAQNSIENITPYEETVLHDNKFDDSNSSSPEYVLEAQYDILRNKMAALWQQLKGEELPLPVKNSEDPIDKTSIEQLASKVNELRTADVTTTTTYLNTRSFNGTYTNHHNYTYQ